MSRVELARVGAVFNHPHADRLSITWINGNQVVFPTIDHKEGDIVAYIPVDSLVPVRRPEFSWLHATNAGGYHRVRAKKMRGIVSRGFIIPLPEDLDLEIEQWQPKAKKPMTIRYVQPPKYPSGVWALAAAISIPGYFLLPLVGAVLLTVIAIVMSELLIHHRWGYK